MACLWKQHATSTAHPSKNIFFLVSFRNDFLSGGDTEFKWYQIQGGGINLEYVTQKSKYKQEESEVIRVTVIHYVKL